MLAVYPNEEIVTIKERLKKQNSKVAQADQFDLKFANRILADQRRLSDYNINNQSILELNLE